MLLLRARMGHPLAHPLKRSVLPCRRTRRSSPEVLLPGVRPQVTYSGWIAPGITVHKPDQIQVSQAPSRRSSVRPELPNPGFRQKDPYDTPFSRYVDQFFNYHDECVGGFLSKKARCSHPLFPPFAGDTARVGSGILSRVPELRTAPKTASPPSQSGAKYLDGETSCSPPGSPSDPIRP